MDKHMEQTCLPCVVYHSVSFLNFHAHCTGAGCPDSIWKTTLFSSHCDRVLCFTPLSSVPQLLDFHFTILLSHYGGCRDREQGLLSKARRYRLGCHSGAGACRPCKGWMDVLAYFKYRSQRQQGYLPRTC